jgi:hypothetical protein
MKFVRTTTANAGYFGGSIEGTITWAYDLTGIDQPAEIVLPPGCQIDAPTLPDATNLHALPNWMGFETQSAVAEVTAFYMEELPTHGWTLSESPLVAPDSEVTLYAKGNELLNVIAVATDSATRVELLLSPS